MSQVKGTEIPGDVAIGRHITAGGNARVQGNATVKKNLRVEGWLDAPNIKGPNKGHFLTLEKLQTAYPEPKDGWWALVGTGLPAPIYIVEGGKWIATGESGGNPVVEIYPDEDDEDALTLQEVFPVIRFNQLDTLGTDGTPDSLKKFFRDSLQTRFRVISSNKMCVGILDLVSDSMEHVLTEIITTHELMMQEEGGGHTDSKLRTYFRSYNLDSHQLTNAKGTWSEWQLQVNGESSFLTPDEAVDIVKKYL